MDAAPNLEGLGTRSDVEPSGETESHHNVDASLAALRIGTAQPGRSFALASVLKCIGIRTEPGSSLGKGLARGGPSVSCPFPYRMPRECDAAVGPLSDYGCEKTDGKGSTGADDSTSEILVMSSQMNGSESGTRVCRYPDNKTSLA
jgi:hypothetical protein